MSLEIRAYNVLFGDCLLLSWDEDDGEHHAWVDFGNFHNDKNEVFDTVYESALKRTKGNLDLVVITHRHLDHLEGFHTLRHKFAADYAIDRLWHAHVTASVDGSLSVARDALASLLPKSAQTGEGEIGRIYHNNFAALGAVSTKDRMQAILDDLGAKKAHAVHRDTKLSTIVPKGIKRLRFEILAPERDSRVYLKSLQQALAARKALGRHFEASTRPRGRAKDPNNPWAGASSVPALESHLEAYADFARLRRQLQDGGLELLAAVDKTRNNTSIVLKLTYGKHTLLLTGDAEEKSWEIMRENGASFSSDMIKVGHHGSINASPDWCYEEVFETKAKTNRVLLSTEPTRFTGTNEVPKDEVVQQWKSRLHADTKTSNFKRTDAKALGGYQKFVFAD